MVVLKKNAAVVTDELAAAVLKKIDGNFAWGAVKPAVADVCDVPTNAYWGICEANYVNNLNNKHVGPAGAVAKACYFWI